MELRSAVGQAARAAARVMAARVVVTARATVAVARSMVLLETARLEALVAAAPRGQGLAAVAPLAVGAMTVALSEMVRASSLVRAAAVLKAVVRWVVV